MVQHIRDATNGNYALGSARFQEQIAEALGRRAIRSEVGCPVRSPPEIPGQRKLAF